MALSMAFSVTRGRGCEERSGQADGSETEEERDAASILTGSREVLREEGAEVLAWDEHGRTTRATTYRQGLRQARDAADRCHNDENLLDQSKGRGA
jgi:hypothetical protein